MTTGAVSNVEWEGLCRAVGHLEWLEDPRFKTAAGRVKYIDDRLELTQQALAEGTTAEWLERLDAHGVPCAPILTRHELLTNEQILANELIVESDDENTGPQPC